MTAPSPAAPGVAVYPRGTRCRARGKHPGPGRSRRRRCRPRRDRPLLQRAANRCGGAVVARPLGYRSRSSPSGGRSASPTTCQAQGSVGRATPAAWPPRAAAMASAASQRQSAWSPRGESRRRQTR